MDQSIHGQLPHVLYQNHFVVTASIFSTQAKKAIKSYTASRFLCFGVVGELKTDDKASRA